jgi:hypothetical protein
VKVIEAPATRLTSAEWDAIVEARRSYQRMWGGGDREAQSIKEDSFDGRGQSAMFYRTTHYIGSIATPGRPDKLLTMRKVALKRESVAVGREVPLPEDLSFWKVRDTQRAVDTSLPECVKTYLENELRLGPFSSVAQLPVAALSRTGTLPCEAVGTRHPDDRNRSAVAFALMQVAAALDDIGNILYAAQLCDEFRTRAFALHLPTDARIEPHYVPAFETLHLSRDRHRVVLDRTNAKVQQILCNFPGFWLDNQSLAAVLVALVREMRLTADHLRPAAIRLCESEDVEYLADQDALLVGKLAQGRRLRTIDLEVVAALLARPRFAKYATDLIRDDAGVAGRILTEVADGPYASLVRPPDLLASSLHLLSVAAEMYQ